MRLGYDAQLIETRYVFLDLLPESLYAAIVTHPLGELEARTDGVMALRNALLAGRLPVPGEMSWPDEPLRTRLLETLDGLGIARFCRDQAELVDALLQSVLEIASRPDLLESDFFELLLEELKAEEKARLRAAEKTKRRRMRARKREKSRAGNGEATVLTDEPFGDDEEHAARVELDKNVLARLIEEAADRAKLEAIREVLARFKNEWAEKVRIWAELAAVFGELGALIGRGWDLARGVLSSQGWLDIVRLAKLLERVPKLKELVRTIGRMQSTEEGADEPPVLEQVVGPLRRAHEEIKLVEDPRVPAETRGVTLSDDITRMLPAEAVMLGHPKLRLLWHARRAERRLATYHVSGVMAERHLVEGEEVEATEETPRPPEKMVRGPIVVCLDTSGSMQGAPELVAKAVTLEVVRVATAERRRCYIYLFSSRYEVAEHELSVSPDGLAELIQFVSMSFHGGTEVSEPFRRALTRLGDEEWKRADILLVSDGEFPAPSATVEEVNQARDRLRLRVHGLLVASRRSEGMEALCDPVHRFDDWNVLSSGRRMAGALMPDRAGEP